MIRMSACCIGFRFRLVRLLAPAILFPFLFFGLLTVGPNTINSGRGGTAFAQSNSQPAGKSNEAEPASDAAVKTRPIKTRPGQTGRPLPRFVSLRAAKVNLRTGPGTRHPIDWVFTRRGLPVEVIDEFDTWRRVRDWQGSIGWVHQSMIQGQRMALVVGQRRRLRRQPDDTAPGVALVDAGVVGSLLGCDDRWCRVEVKGFEGWLERSEIYGVYPGETVK